MSKKTRYLLVIFLPPHTQRNKHTQDYQRLPIKIITKNLQSWSY